MNWFKIDAKPKPKAQEQKPLEYKICEKNLQSLEKAKSVAEKYASLSSCCTLLSEIDVEQEEGVFYPSRSGGWRVYTSQLKSAGIDLDDIYAHIKSLVLKKKNELLGSLQEFEEEADANSFDINCRTCKYEVDDECLSLVPCENRETWRPKS